MLQNIVSIVQAVALAVLLAGCASSGGGKVASAQSSLPAPLAAGQADAAASTASAPHTLSADSGAPVRQAQAAVASQDSAPGAPSREAFIRETAQDRHLPPDHVARLFDQAAYNGTVARLMTPSGTRVRRSWTTYRQRFVEPIRIRNGVAFWQQHRQTLDAVAAQQGVPASILTAIIGVETLYGRDQGSFRVLDALYTLGFHFPDPSRPQRAQFFREQLADLIQLDHERRLDATQVKGSYAGAMGLPQFMPGSLMRFAADGDQDGRIDLFASVDDAIASVARFLRLHGWQPGLPVFAPVALPADAGALVAGGLEPSTDWPTLRGSGALARDTQASQAWQAWPLGVIDLRDESRNAVEYRTATPNFFAITQYNRSYFYAASVADLAQELAQRMGYGAP